MRAQSPRNRDDQPRTDAQKMTLKVSVSTMRLAMEPRYRVLLYLHPPLLFICFEGKISSSISSWATGLCWRLNKRSSKPSNLPASGILYAHSGLSRNRGKIRGDRLVLRPEPFGWVSSRLPHFKHLCGRGCVEGTKAPVMIDTECTMGKCLRLPRSYCDCTTP
jgi:hypothetical protein